MMTRKRLVPLGILASAVALVILAAPVLVTSSGGLLGICGLDALAFQDDPCADERATIQALSSALEAQSYQQNDAYFLRATVAAQDRIINNTADCGNGLAQRLWRSGRGWVVPEPPLPSSLRDEPGGSKTGEIPAGGLFTVTDGPQCASNGISWWYVESEYGAGWISEGNNGEYFIGPTTPDGTDIETFNDFSADLGMACPYIFGYDDARGKWLADNAILYRIAGKENERAQSRILNVFDGRLLIREFEPETSYIDQVYVVAQLGDETVTLYPDEELLQSADGAYLVLGQGDEIRLEFAGFEELDRVDEVWIVTTGYYVPYAEVEIPGF